MAYQIYGVAAAQCMDKSGETIIIDGIDDSRLNVINDEHKDDCWGQLGVITKHKKIHSLQECEDPRQVKCWNLTQVPFLYVEGALADEDGHPNAQAATALIKFTSRMENSPLHIGLSIEGGIVQRGGHDDKTLEKTIGTKASFTVKPCNPKCLLFPLVDLQKSTNMPPMPSNYMEALAKADSTTSFIERKVEVLNVFLTELKKTVGEYQDSFTSMKCHGCGKGVRFFKSSGSVPNKCPHCEESFHLSQIWSAIKA